MKELLCVLTWEDNVGLIGMVMLLSFFFVIIFNDSLVNSGLTGLGTVG